MSAGLWFISDHEYAAPMSAVQQAAHNKVSYGLAASYPRSGCGMVFPCDVADIEAELPGAMPFALQESVVERRSLEARVDTERLCKQPTRAALEAERREEGRFSLHLDERSRGH